MLSCSRNTKNVLSLESDTNVDDRHINKTKEIILGYGAYQHTKTEFFKTFFSCPSMENTFWLCLLTQARAEYGNGFV